MILETLYKRTSVGKIQQWGVEIDGSRYRTISGQRDGKLVESAWTVATPKNVGKSNELTATAQAEAEVEALYAKKLAQGGYKRDVDDIDNAEFFKPMLAKSWDDCPIDNFDSGKHFSQPKLDGIRCIAKADGLWTRQGKPIPSTPHIYEALKPFFAANPDAILDGELYGDKLSQDFNKIVSLVKKVNPDAARLAESAELVQYHVYDFPSVDGPFWKRIQLLTTAVMKEIDHPSIIVVDTIAVNSLAHLDELNGQYLEAGYEGQIVRTSDAPYEQKRSKQLLKRKVFQDEEFVIISINEGVGNRSGMAGFITYELDGERTFGSGIRGSHDWCRDLLASADSYVGGTGTVRYFGLTPDGVPRFPVTTAVFEGFRDI